VGLSVGPWNPIPLNGVGLWTARPAPNGVGLWTAQPALNRVGLPSRKGPQLRRVRVRRARGDRVAGTQRSGRVAGTQRSGAGGGDPDARGVAGTRRG
jgi:hypothetical protein